MCYFTILFSISCIKISIFSLKNDFASGRELFWIMPFSYVIIGSNRDIA